MNLDKNHIENLIAKKLTGEATPQELEQLDEWIKADVENANVFSEFEQAFQLSERAVKSKPLSSAIDVDAEWSKLSTRLDIESRDDSLERSGGSMWLKIAAVFTLIIVGSFAAYQLVNQPDHAILAENVQDITLPDGTIVTLKAGAELSYNDEYGQANRMVSLSGQAFFDVKRDENAPFIIESENSVITVLGTSFNVDTRDDYTEVTVTTGRVSLSHDGSEVILNPGHVGLNEAGELSKTDNKDVNYLSWKTGVMNFENSSLSSVITTLNEVYEENIAISAPSHADSCTVTVTFDNQSLDAVLKVLESTLNLTIDRENDNITITEAGC